jgi:hypothetical protein
MDDGFRVHPLGSIQEIAGAAKNRIYGLIARVHCRLMGTRWWRAILRWATPVPTMPEVAEGVKVNHCAHRMRDRSQFDELRRRLAPRRKWS